MRRIFAGLAVVLTAATLQTASSALAQDESVSFHVQIRSGTCADLGEGIAQLDDLSLAGATVVGAPGAAVAGSSYSVAPVALDALTGSDNSIVLLDGENNTLVACGEIGGVIGPDGALSIGLRPTGESGYSGIVYLAPNAAQTGVSTFLSATGAGEGDEGAAESPAVMSQQAYSSMISSQLTILVGSLQRIDRLFANANADDAGWTSQVGAELFLWKLLFRVASDVNPPAAYVDLNEQYLAALALLDGAASDILKALETSDNELLATASAKIQDAVAALRGLNTPDDTGTPTP